ncbi:hypothetical protein P7D22_09595 [Lichenihabitans sp. Uapishka_5]|uniref:hypothetical protein n=1 Tax=Lichenihabitans sp. Uapishka_5 TaxID=3037302 RepID=UPI0029E81318|nr:hypothetical protein [Lichenihabitans sp. Uapishka_5]MDX7951422.1 hypothetical protein [Lichenihabitans sp. Uapishka_5]
MIVTHTRATRFVLTFAHQLGLSVLGTVVATALVSGLAPERPPVPRSDPASISSLPILTSGGKYASRALAGDEPQPFVQLTSLPILLPLFTAAAVPPLTTEAPAAAAQAADTAMAFIATTDQAGRPVHGTMVKREARHLAQTSGIASRSQDRQAGTIVMAALPHLEADGAGAPSLLARSQTAYRDVALWRDALLDHLLP